jgi:cation:H+ antiporter
MLVESGWFLGGLVLLLLGGDSMVKGVAGLARHAGATAYRAGLFLLVFATAVPELAVNAYAVKAGQPELALGNAVGSNIVNLGLTLGVAALAAPMVVRMRLVALQLVMLLVAGGAVLFFALDGQIARWEGGVLVAGFVALLVLFLRRADDEDPAIQAEIADTAETATGLVRNLVRIAIAAAVLGFGGYAIVRSAPVLGAAMGFGPLLTGLLPVAIGTALPEIALAVMAARNGHGNVVAGTVLGASLCNFLVVLGGMALYQPLAVPASFVSIEVPAAMALTLALYPLLGGDLKLSRREGGVLVGLFVAWVAYELVTVWG